MTRSLAVLSIISLQVLACIAPLLPGSPAVVHTSQLQPWLLLPLLAILAAILITMMLQRGTTRARQQSDSSDEEWLPISGGGSAIPNESPPPHTPPLSPGEADALDAWFKDVEVVPTHQSPSDVPDDACCVMFRCQGRTQDDKTCRKRGAGHGTRGAICPLHAERASFIRCANGCEFYCHVGCFDQLTRKPISCSWICGFCPTATAVDSLKADAADDAVGDDSVGDSSQLFSEDKASTETKEDCCFDSITDLHSHMRVLGFSQITHNQNTKREKISILYRCSECIRTFTAKRCSNDTESWKANPVPHLTSCSHHHSEVDDAAASKHIMKQHDFIKKPGLLEFIETLGACGEVRSDQIARAVAKHFDGAIVESNLLYRTAKKAQEKVFGRTTSDVMALQELAQRIVDGDGVLEFVYGVCSRVLVFLQFVCGVHTRHLHFNCHLCAWCRHLHVIVFLQFVCGVHTRSHTNLHNLLVVSTPVICILIVIYVRGVDTCMLSYFCNLFVVSTPAYKNIRRERSW